MAGTFTQNALQVVEKRYLLRTHDGTPTETPDQMFGRVARALAQVEGKYGASPGKIAEYATEFYEIMRQFKFSPAGRYVNRMDPLGFPPANILQHVGQCRRADSVGVQLHRVAHRGLDGRHLPDTQGCGIVAKSRLGPRIPFASHEAGRIHHGSVVWECLRTGFLSPGMYFKMFKNWSPWLLFSHLY